MNTGIDFLVKSSHYIPLSFSHNSKKCIMLNRLNKLNRDKYLK